MASPQGPVVVQPHPLLLLRTGAATVALLLLGGCTSGGTPASRSDAQPSSQPASVGTATPPATPPPPPPAPKNGACYRLSAAELTRPTNQSSPVSCRTPHNAQTVYVGRLDNIVDGHALTVDSDQVQRQLASMCPQRLDAHVGGSVSSRRLSRINVVWFSPTLDQSDRGADWFRCDLIAFGRGGSLVRLPAPRRTNRVLDRPGALRTWGLCGSAAPGSPHFARVICAYRHSWRAISTIPLRGGERYPGQAAVQRAGDPICRNTVKRLAGSALKFSYGWEWPTADQWQNGQRYGYCWAPA